MKKLIMSVLMLTTIIAITYAQPPAPPQPGAPPAPRGREQLQQVTAFNGNAKGLVANDDYVYDGFYMQAGQDSLLVKFPPHLGTQIANAVKSGKQITVNGTLEYPPFCGKEVRMVSVIINGQTIYDAPPANSPTPPADNFVRSNGKITGTQTDREGKVNGLIIDNKTILRVPPHIAYQLTDIAKNGSAVEYSGMQKQPATGEILSNDFKIVRCNTISINGQQYLIQ
jgi:hypothetical protein